MTRPSTPITVWDVIENPTMRAELEERLRTAELSLEFESADGPLEIDGSQGCVVAQLSTGELVVVKRSDQTVQGVPLDGLGLQWVRNEAAGYEVARLLELEDLVLPTVRRDAELPGGTKIEVAVRLYVEASPNGSLVEGAALTSVSPDQRARAALFDRVVEQSDRRVSGDHGGNWYVLTEPDREPRLLLFDHQLCFGARPEIGLASGIWDMAGHLLGAHLHTLNALLTDEARTRLSEYLPEESFSALIERVRSLADYS